MRGKISAAALLAVTLAAGPTAEEPQRTSKIEISEVSLVLIDTVVTGEGGRPVAGLKAQDFLLRVDGRDAPVAGFEDRCAERPPAPSTGPPPSESPEGTPGSVAGPSVAASVAAAPDRIILYFDLPHLSPHGAARSVRAARRYLETSLPAGARVMVIASGSETRILAPFTIDAGAIAAALDRVTSPGSTYDEGPFARGRKIEDVTMETCPQNTPGGICSNQIAMARDYAHQEEVLARRSLGALRATMSALAGLPGRKALVFFTETLKDEPGVQYLEIARTTPAAQQISLQPDLRLAIEEANDALVSFYPVFAGGLEDPSESEFGRTLTSLGTKAERAPIGKEGRPGPPVMKGGKSQMEVQSGVIARAWRSAEAASLGFNASVAAETGGRHLGRTNDLSQVFRIVEDDLSCYYVLAYRPPSSPDGKRHMIEVEVRRQGTEVRARPYYVDLPPAQRASRRLDTAMAAPGAFTGFDVVLSAFALGRSKEGRQVLVKVSVPCPDLARSAAGVPPDDGSALVEIRGRITTPSREACAFGAEFLLEGVAAAARDRGAFHYEAACSLPPGRYEIVAAVMEKRGGATAASRREIGVPAIEGLFVSDADLWAASRADLVNKAQAEPILGPSKGIEKGVATPRAERRLAVGERGSLFFLVCPDPRDQRASGAGSANPKPVTVTRAILAGEDPVATFPPIRLEGAPDPASGCWGIVSALADNTLGEGIYTFEYAVHAPYLSEPVEKRVAFAVGGEGKAPSEDAAPGSAPTPPGRVQRASSR